MQRSEKTPGLPIDGISSTVSVQAWLVVIKLVLGSDYSTNREVIIDYICQDTACRCPDEFVRASDSASIDSGVIFVFTKNNLE